MIDKYGSELKVGDIVVISSYNIFTNKTTFEKGVITRLYTVVDAETRQNALDLAEVELVNGETIDGVSYRGIIKVF